MNKNIAAIAITFILAGCANSAGDYATASGAKYDGMKAALKAAEPALNRCAHDRQPSEISRKEFMQYTTCTNRIIETKILPISNYPDLLERFIAVKTENAALYSQGKIDYEQVEARRKLNLLNLKEESEKRDMQTIQRLSAEDAAENDDMANALASFKQSPAVRTTCSSYGSITNCVSR